MKRQLFGLFLLCACSLVFAVNINTMFIGKWANTKASCRGNVQGDDYRVLTIKNTKTNQIKDERYAGYSFLNIMSEQKTISNKLQAKAYSYIFHDEESDGTLHRDIVKIDYVIIGHQLHDTHEYIDENGDLSKYTATLIKCP